MSGVDIVEFLLARIAEDEAAAEAAAMADLWEQDPNRPGHWTVTPVRRPQWEHRESADRSEAVFGSVVPVPLNAGENLTALVEPIEDSGGGWCGGVTDGEGEHIARYDPARVLAECAAKRAIIEQCKHEAAGYRKSDDHWEGGRADGMKDTIRILAAVYAEHPDYRQEWQA